MRIYSDLNESERETLGFTHQIGKNQTISQYRVSAMIEKRSTHILCDWEYRLVCSL